MNTTNPRLLTLSLAIVVALAACKKADEAPTAAATAEPQAASLTLDESKLPTPATFAVADLDAGKECSDFNEYVNGKWAAANPIPGDRSSWGVSEILGERSLAIQHQLAEQAAADKHATGVEKIIGDFWATGMDEAKIEAQGIAPIQPQLTSIDGLNDTAAIVGYIRKQAAIGDNPVFDFGAEADFKQSSMNIAYASQGGLGLPDKTYYFDADKREVLDAYRAHIAKVLELSGAAAADATQQAKTVIAFETRLAKASLSQEDLRDVSLYYHPVSLAEADKLTPNFSWTEFFKSQDVAAPGMFSLPMPAFHQEVSRMLGDTDPAAWRSYLRFHAVDGAAPYLSDKFVQENFNFYSKTLYGQKEIKQRWKRVLGTLNGEAGEAMGQLYVKVAFPADSKARMETLVGNLRTALKGRIENLPWMSDETKQKAIAKWETFTPKIGYPDKWRDWSGLATSRDSFLGNVMAAEAFNYRWNLGKIGKPVDKTEWGMSPQTVNAYYNPLQNEIVFPAAILQPPFFDANADDAINYGGIGATIGHEMLHGYDDQGSRFGPTGNFENWWTEADAKGFSALTGKLEQQFSAYTIPTGEHVNGKTTLGENIADLGGLDVAYDALLKANDGKPDPKTDGLTRDQRFFIGYALSWRGKDTPESLKVQVASDPHAPSQFRANGPLENLSTFASAFQCKAGDPMVRADDRKVAIW